MADFLKSFWHEAFATAGALGLAAYAMPVIVALVAIATGARVRIAVFAILCVVGLVIANYLIPPVLTIRHPHDSPAAPARSIPNGARWFDPLLQADWGGRDEFYGAGQFPRYEAAGKTLRDENRLGRVVTCWSSRPADSASLASDVPTDIPNRTGATREWCAYKDSSVTLAVRPDGRFPGRVYVCANSILPH
jgi:hypothetical protein